MWLKLATFGLLPVLLIQGTKVRRHTPRLPEASGDREGRIGQGKPLSLLILGDSAAAGVGVETQQDALSGAITAELRSEFMLQWKLHAKTGDTTKQVLQAIHDLEPQSYDVVVTSIGVNDVTKLTSAKTWIKQQKQLFTQIQTRFQPKLIIVSGVPPMQHFPALPQPLAWLFGKYAEQMNDTLQQWVAAQTQFRFIQYDIESFQAMNLPMASDGFHPSKEIYAIWGQQVAALVRQTFNA
ncbi:MULTISPECIES: SGNH/GDSL hydrolase family protein [unclassified Acinetobacter]|uniref:SGNH/GDSL hydrolase family protein n=1 Tax=unclassified Acinetobacter TaxID=196816 RepID=UPI00244C583C|nr:MULTISPECIES: SGNH/GDSL hydrolase family protein [unclassified Acinetobacter]MDH0030357.1 SGNH/GDSL hydrolase family protein [Acinetobacter sp. GD04021]MDH0885925.1 SGNH/GDSL hydrolase family protein [Acinetobacter sp. GD03873]MDH1082545.1 SGNH/GDSL hydrolase family protein [Acinetobacter sp. GD03983]MDH2189063.1 SGNH/GDSL hydrolase family protein [Acinetobacter sp. GD03645]MDH2202251.1 SGNH/GDSL hydrolase family protein [Acinetobacter sp. GD03647]